MPQYASGKRAKAMCPRCGVEVAYRTLKEEWTGLWTCRECHDAKHPQIDPIRRIHDPTALEHPWPDVDEDGTVTKELEDNFPATGFGSRGDI